MGVHLIPSVSLNPHDVVGEFYGQGFTVANLELVARFFEKYPEYADRTFLSVKGGLLPGQVHGLKLGQRLYVARTRYEAFFL